MRRSAAAIALSFVPLSAVSLAVADETTHRQAAEELLSVVNTQDSLNRAIDQLVEMQVRQQPRLGPLKATFQVFFQKHMSFPALKDEFVKLYVAEFSEKELRETATFYRSPTGAKIIEKLPTLMQRGSQIGLQRVQAQLPELKAQVEAELAKQPGATPPKGK